MPIPSPWPVEDGSDAQLPKQAIGSDGRGDEQGQTEQQKGSPPFSSADEGEHEREHGQRKRTDPRLG